MKNKILLVGGFNKTNALANSLISKGYSYYNPQSHRS